MAAVRLGKPQKKVLLLMAGPLRGGGKGWAIIEKKTFFWNLFFPRSKISTAIKLGGGGGGLDRNCPASQRITFFCGFPCQAFKRREGIVISFEGVMGFNQSSIDGVFVYV